MAKTLTEQYNSNKLREQNKTIRGVLAGGMPIEEVARQFSPDNIDTGYEILGAMSLAETHDMSLGHAYAALPGVIRNAFGSGSTADAVKKIMLSSEPYSVPIQPISPEKIKEEIELDEIGLKAALAQSERGLPTHGMMQRHAGAFNQSVMSSKGILQKEMEFAWQTSDPKKNEFYEGMMNADTEEKRDALRKERFKELFSREQERLDRLDQWERNIEQMNVDPAGIWLSKVNAWGQGSGRVAQAGLDMAGDLTGLANKVVKSESLGSMSDGMSEWARAYHFATQEPDIAFQSVNWLDKRTNSLLSNAPYTGLMIASSMAAPQAVTPYVMFAGGATMASSSIKQSALDAGRSVEDANLRGWIGGGISGLLEAGGGGAAKYNPKTLFGKIANFPGTLTRNALKEIVLEELPQEAVEAIFGDDVPRSKDGSLDWDEITDRILEVSQDAAFMSVAHTSSSSVVGKAMAWDANRAVNKDTAQAMQDAMDVIVQESEAKQLTQQEQVDADIKAQEDAVATQEATKEQEGEVNGVEDKVAEKEPQAVTERDDVSVAPAPVAVPVKEQLKNTGEYGVVLQPDGKFAVVDWRTQQEIKTNLDKKSAVQQAVNLNSGEESVSQRRAKTVLPTSQDIETLTHTQLLRVVFNAVSKNARIVAKNTATKIISEHANLVEYAKTQLNKLPISESQRNRLIKKVATAETDADVKSAVTIIEAIRENSRKSVETKRFNKIRALSNKSGKLKLRDGGIHHSAHKVISDLLSQYTSLSGKVLNSIKRSASYLDGIRKGIEGDFGEAYAEALMPKGLSNKLSEAMATPIDSLTADQLSDLNNTLERFLRQAQLYGRLTLNRQAREFKNYLNNATAKVKLKKSESALEGQIPKRGFWKSTFDLFGGIKQDDIYTLSTKIWGRFNPVEKLVQRSRRQQLHLALKYREFMRSLIEESGVSIEQMKDWSGFLHNFGLHKAKEIAGKGESLHEVMIGGKPRNFTMGEIMAIAMHTRNTHNLRQIIKNGIGTHRERIGKITKSELKEIVDIVNNDPQAKKFVDGLTAFYLMTASDMNKVSRSLDGIDIANEEDYFHVSYVPEGGVVGTEYVRDAMVDEEGRLKARTSSNRPVAVHDIFQVISEDINVTSQFSGTAKAVRKLRSLANYAPFRKRMRDAGADHVLSEFDTRIKRFQVTRLQPSDALEKRVEKLTRSASLATLIDPRIWALQPTSAVLYATEVSPKYMKAVLSKLNAMDIESLRKHWTLFAARHVGVGASKAVATRSDTKKIFTDSGTAADKALAGMHRADMLGISQAAKIVFAEMSDRTMAGTSLEWWQNYGVNPTTLKFGTQAYWDAFNDRADHLVTYTQPMFFSENRSAFTGSENPYTRALFRFRGFIDQLGRIVRRNIDMAKYGEVSKAEASYNIGVVTTLLSVMTPLIKFAFAKLFGKDKTSEELFRDMITAPLSTIPLIGYPIKQITDTLIGGESTATPTFSAMPLMIVNRMLRHSWETARGVNALLDDEFIRSGPNRGKKKSEVFLKKGISGAARDMLILYGIPTKIFEDIEWFDE